MKYFHKNQVYIKKCQMEVPKHQRKKVERYLFNDYCYFNKQYLSI